MRAKLGRLLVGWSAQKNGLSIPIGERVGCKCARCAYLRLLDFQFECFKAPIASKTRMTAASLWGYAATCSTARGSW